MCMQLQSLSYYYCWLYHMNWLAVLFPFSVELEILGYQLHARRLNLLALPR